MARRGAPGRNRSPSRRLQSRPAASPPPLPAPHLVSARAGREAQAGFALGVLAMFVLPLAYQWTARPTTNPFGSTTSILVIEAVAIVAAAAALLFGRRARAAGDRSNPAVWAPRLGAAAMVGYVMTLVIAVSKGA